jgi:hypothetical protein
MILGIVPFVLVFGGVAAAGLLLKIQRDSVGLQDD